MGFAKLSSALLVCDRPPVTTVITPVSLPPRVEPIRPAVEDQRRLARNLKALRLPRFLGEYDTLARQCIADGQDHYRYLLRLTELELGERERRAVERRIKAARFPAVKTLGSFEVTALPPQTWGALLGLAQSEYVLRQENVVAVGKSGTGKTHLAVGLGRSACEQGLSVGFTTAAGLVHDLLEARRDHHLSRLQRRLAGYKLLIVDDLGYVTFPADGAELLFEVLSQRCERASTLVTSSLPPAEWGRVFGSERLAGALVDRLTHRVHLLDLSGDNYRRKADGTVPRAGMVSALLGQR